MSWIIEPASAFASRAGDWRALNHATLDSPLLAPEFVAPLLAHFGSGNELMARYEHGGQVAAMALLARRNAVAWDTFQPSQAPIGLWMARRQFCPAMLTAGLLRALPGIPLSLGLLQRDPALEARPASAGPLATMDYIDTARVTVSGSFDAYWAARGKNLRSNLKKQRARLAREGVTTRIEMLGNPLQVETAIADYARLEQSGWKAHRGTAVHATEAQGRFYRALFESYCARGLGRIYRYWFGDRLVAMDLCLAVDGTLLILKTAYDEAAPHGLSPALLMREDQFRAVFAEDAIHSIEFYGKVMEWHTRWTDEVRRMYHVTAFRWPLLATFKRLLKARLQPPAAGLRLPPDPN